MTMEVMEKGDNVELNTHVAEVAEEAVAPPKKEKELNLPPKQDFTDEEMAEILTRTVPKRNCKHCYGRGQMGRNVVTGKRIVCVCVDKAARIIAKEVAARRATYKHEVKEIAEDAVSSGITIINPADSKTE